MDRRLNAGTRWTCWALAVAAIAGLGIGGGELAVAGGAVPASAGDGPPLLELDTLARETVPELGALRRIVIDPGHGGRNVGALGVGHIHEKHLTLPIAMYLADQLRARHPDLEVVLTRQSDVDLGLSERAELANAHDADLFISVHLNSATNPEAVGYETWWLQDCTPPMPREGSRAVALFEMAAELGEFTRTRCAAADKGRAFAETLHGAYHDHLPAEVMDRGVKQGNFTVLRRAEVPAVVVELGFLSHDAEGVAALDPQWQATMVDAMVEGVERYDAWLVESGGSTAVASAEAQ